MDVTEMFLQGCKPAEDFEPGDVTDGICGRVVVKSKALRPRADMVPLVMLDTEDGQWLRYEPGFPVAYYGTTPTLDMWPGRFNGTPCPDGFRPSDL